MIDNCLHRSKKKVSVLEISSIRGTKLIKALAESEYMILPRGIYDSSENFRSFNLKMKTFQQVRAAIDMKQT